jgi:hypothetical protein
MPFARIYSRDEVKGMMQLYFQNKAVQGVDAQHRFVRSAKPAHYDAHAGASYLDMRDRVNTVDEPRTTSTYWSDAVQIDATMELLNSAVGQVELAILDDPTLAGPEKRANIRTNFVNDYAVAVAYDRSNVPGNAGHLIRANPLRAGSGARIARGIALNGYVLAVPGVAGLLQIQTSYPDQLRP